MRVTLGSRWKFFLVHFASSVSIVLILYGLVFSYWYPYPYAELSAGRSLFGLVVLVDVVIGPILTALVYRSTKSIRELRFDISLIVLLQIAAMAYGIWVLAAGRPVHMVFEIDRFRVVHASEIPVDSTNSPPQGIELYPLNGPTVLGLKKFANSAELAEATMVALQGISISSRPEFWRHYSDSQNDVILASQPLAALISRFPGASSRLNQLSTSIPMNEMRYVPVIGRGVVWTAIVSANDATIISFLPVDPF